MPYKLRHAKGGGFDIIKLSTGETVAHSDSKKKAIGYIWHAKQTDKETQKKGKK